ncbi:EamA family transporter [Pseudomonas sp. AOB-7]|uniref:EamA family transporter n=1 Tax=Pseudomonas sp. AOB-7 TaxID=2482750 RepID=UPI000EFBAF72|nr:EamA family transporter [Pseudomonas sp. AOB-7]RMH85561.1 EamA family transporter [Pseudomonas sp. AOB-7]
MPPRILLLTALAMLAFAGNSLLCRLALRETAIDAASFTAIRLACGALTLWLLLRLRTVRQPMAGNWPGALALFAYAAAFSFAYLQLDTGVGALLLFGAVQLSMLLWGLWRGERLGLAASLGTALAAGGLLALLLPGASAPPLAAALLMLLAGIAWGGYSLLGRGQGDPLAVTAGNFLRAAPLALLLALTLLPRLSWDGAGLCYALLSGALTSGVGYAIWYSALPGLRASQAATVQLSVPILAALGGALLLGEALSLRLLLSAGAVLGGIALVLGSRQRRAGS